MPMVGFIIITCLLLTGCVMVQPPAPVRVENKPPSTQHKQPSRTQARYHIVKKGENLFRIAWQHSIHYKTLAHWNQLRPPYVIYPKQKIYLYPPRHQLVSKAPTRKPIKLVKKPIKKITKPIVSPPQLTTLTWRWPIHGQILSRFKPNNPQHQAIQISGKAGQIIRAAAPGKVVYSGSSLAGYGQLIIIKHNDTYLSAYGHNRKILVKEGDFIRTGQRIAEMGSFGAERPMLHFEVRKSGKPVNPLKLLPSN